MGKPRVNILLVEDTPEHIRLIREVFSEEASRPFRLEVAESLQAACHRLTQGGIQVVLLDLCLPDSHGMQTLRTLRGKAPRIPIIVLTVLNDSELGLQAVQEGAQDFLVKGQVDAPLLYKSIEYALEREKIFQRLLEAEALYRTLFEQSPAGVLIIDPASGAIREFNDIACSQLGYSREEFQGLSLEDFLAPQETRWWTTLAANQPSKDPEDIETCFTARDGSRRDVLITSRLLSWSGLDVCHCIVLDVTDRKRAREERREFESRIQKLQKFESLEKLAGGLAHDMNNILTGILGFADVAMMRLPPDSSAGEYFQKIITATRKAGNLAAQMLAFSGKGRFISQQLSLSTLIRQISPLIESALPRNCQLRTVLGENLSLIDGDCGQINQAIMNIVTNSSEALESGRGTITIRTGERDCDRAFLSEGAIILELPPGLYAFVEVEDDGCGIPSEVLKLIFDPFFSTKFSGRGLGLSAVLGIMRGHNGTIRVSSEPGKGTTITLFFPAVPAKESATVPQPPTISESRNRGRYILVIDDDESIRFAAREVLEDYGFQVFAAANGLEGLSIFREHRPEIRAILLDLTMPVMDGAETFREVRKLCKEVPILLTSGYTEMDATRHFPRNDLAGFLPKPFSCNELVDALKRILRG